MEGKGDTSKLCAACFPSSAYKDLQTREDIRNAAWHKPGWDELVYYTGNLLTASECWQHHPFCSSVRCTMIKSPASLGCACLCASFPAERRDVSLSSKVNFAIGRTNVEELPNC